MHKVYNGTISSDITNFIMVIIIQSGCHIFMISFYLFARRGTVPKRV